MFDLQITQLRDMIASASRIVAFTGAGVSAESGIPTYRGVGGTWTKYDPDKYASIDYFRRDPTYYWTFFRDVRHDIMNDAQVNPAHLALAKLEREGKLSAVITQNIDGLHQKAGCKHVLELHGNTTRFYCFECQKPYTMPQIKAKVDVTIPPCCDNCGGVLRPDVVMFGEMLPMEVVEEADREVQACDLMIVIGSSLIVYPAANLPYQAKFGGAKVVIINIDPTPFDQYADLAIHAPAGEVMEAAVGVIE